MEDRTSNHVTSLDPHSTYHVMLDLSAIVRQGALVAQTTRVNLSEDALKSAGSTVDLIALAIADSRHFEPIVGAAYPTHVDVPKLSRWRAGDTKQSALGTQEALPAASHDGAEGGFLTELPTFTVTTRGVPGEGRIRITLWQLSQSASLFRAS